MVGFIVLVLVLAGAGVLYKAFATISERSKDGRRSWETQDAREDAEQPQPQAPPQPTPEPTTQSEPEPNPTVAALLRHGDPERITDELLAFFAVTQLKL